jgi:hypothetical protein
MPIQQSIDNAAQMVHTLATAEVINNTFGLISNLHRELQSIQRQLPAGRAGETLGQDTADRLHELVVTIEDKKLLLFGIPEQWLINNVLTAAKAIRQRLEPG